MMDRRAFLAGTGAVLLAAPLAAEAQQDPKVRRIAVVRTTLPALVEARKEGLRRLGWIEGQNIVVETLLLGDRSDAGMQEFARDLVRLKIEVIMASNNTWISAAKAATTTIPIVMVEADDPVGQGYVASLARPGGNITGQTGSVSPETAGKRVEFLAECRPGLSRLACLVDPTIPGYQTYSLAVESASRSRGMATRVVEVREPDELEGAFAMIVKDRMHALVVLGGNFLFNARCRIAKLAVRHRLPTAFPWREGPEEGALLSYGRNIRALWHGAAVYVDKILKGAKPADLPVEQPTKFELVIDLKTAKALGLTIPPSLLGRADELIQ
jgi:putative tryptophan/tyrosine transport system substrate-binding protein